MPLPLAEEIDETLERAIAQPLQPIDAGFRFLENRRRV
ncbi:MAG: hypothetical protein QOD06_1367, partial [Candidatus Binatota bacterium]|nr:hypothetical protein [Candidatus Binatota bacterium]